MAEQQQQQIQPAQAREFVTQFVHDPKVLEGMPDADVLAFHGRIGQAIDKVRPAQQGFGDNWRQAIAGDNADELKQLERYSTPQDIWKKSRELEKRITSGELRAPAPGKDAKPEEVAAWRAQNGIPPTPDKYDLKLKDGLVIGEDDKPIINAILSKVHGKNVNNETASAFVEAYYEQVAEQVKKGGELAAKLKGDTAAALNKKWGAEYTGNLNRIHALIDANVPESSPMKAKIKATLETDADFAELMENFARQINPAGVLIPAGQGGYANALADEIKQIEGKMKAAQAAGRGSPEWKAYYDDEALQGRLRDLYAARDGSAKTG